MPSGVAAPSEIPWLQPYPDQLLDKVAPSAEQPDVAVVAKETIELAFLAAIQLLSANQRAVLILRDVLGWSASETADLLDTSVASATAHCSGPGLRSRSNSQSDGASGRRPTIRAQTSEPCSTGIWRRINERDAAAVVELLREDVRFTMPPQPTCYQDRDAVAAFFENALGAGRIGDFRLVPT